MAQQTVEFSVRERAVYVGRAGSSGSFKDRETGEQVSYSEAHAFDFDSPEGNVQRVIIRADKVEAVAEGFDLQKAKRYVDQVEMQGVVVLNERGGFFKPTRISKVTSAAA